MTRWKLSYEETIKMHPMAFWRLTEALLGWPFSGTALYSVIQKDGLSS